MAYETVGTRYAILLCLSCCLIYRCPREVYEAQLATYNDTDDVNSSFLADVLGSEDRGRD